jgi:hypothetical protein
MKSVFGDGLLLGYVVVFGKGSNHHNLRDRRRGPKGEEDAISIVVPLEGNGDISLEPL